MKISQIAEASSEKEYTVDVPFMVSNDGAEQEEKLTVTYRTLTAELFDLARTSAAAFLARVIIKWNAEEEPTLDFLMGRDIRFVQKIAGAVLGDFTQR